MRLEALGALIAACLLLLASCQSGDSRCNAANCEALMSCRLALGNYGQCASLAEEQGLDAGTVLGLIGQYCIETCNANGEGALLECVDQNFTEQTCLNIGLDGGDQQSAIDQTCNINPDAGVCTTIACSLCQIQCNQTQQTCSNGCVDAGGTFDAGVCFACTYACDQQNVQCLSQCTTS